jgi:hypothetical protein
LIISMVTAMGLSLVVAITPPALSDTLADT